MITASPAPTQRPTAADGEADWQHLWRDSVRDPVELLQMLGLPQLADRIADGGLASFPLRVPRGFVARMRPGDPDDPLLRQVLPLDAEDQPRAGFDIDAVGDLAARVGRGLLHKYAGRALLVSTGACAIHCRYCFRRHYGYADDSASAGRWGEALDALRARPGIRELILSGGDPLSLGNARLAELFTALPGLPGLRTLRIHTRLPVVLPERVDRGLLALLEALPLRRVVVIHANHPDEINAPVAAAIGALRAVGAVLLNQSVLLRGVNDDPEVLAGLSERLFDAGVLPYYLHQLDRVAGTAHFEVDDARALALAEALRDRLPGYLVPRLVREVAGAPAKLGLRDSRADLP